MASSDVLASAATREGVMEQSPSLVSALGNQRLGLVRRPTALTEVMKIHSKKQPLRETRRQSSTLEVSRTVLLNRDFLAWNVADRGAVTAKAATAFGQVYGAMTS